MNTKFINKLFFAFLFCLTQNSLFAQQTSDSLNYERYKFALEELEQDSTDNLITLATQTTLRLRDAPSVVSVITRADIEAMNARDLSDILRHIQGFDFGVDVNGVVGIGLRGNWAHEGKILLMIDGLEMNELMYGTTQLGNHFPPSLIERIEVIRGAGSAIYGGFAEYGVINIVTRGSENLNGLQISNTLGKVKNNNDRNSPLRQNLTASLGRSSIDWKAWGSIFKGNALRSNQFFIDGLGNKVDMSQNSLIETFTAQVGINYKKLEIRGIWDDYRNNTKIGFAYEAPNRFQRIFQTGIIDAKYIIKVNEKLTITPRISYTFSRPWAFLSRDTVYSGVFSREYTQRFRSNLIGNYRPSSNLIFTLGSEFWYDAAYDDIIFFNEKNYIEFNNVAFFSQILWKTKLVNITAGARYDNHSFYPSTFVPRFGLTKSWKKLHLKLLYSNAFRAPSVQNINLSINQSIKPERTTVLESEIGYIFSPNFSTTLNFYDITTKDPIIYFVESNTIEGYNNEKETGTRGAELELRYKGKKGFVEVTYSYYTAAGKTVVNTSAVSEDKNQLLGLAPQKLSIWANHSIYKSLKLNTSLVWLSSRYAYNSETQDGELLLKKFDSNTLFNISFMYKDFLRSGINVSIGIQDLFNQSPPFMQPYDGAHTPLPNLSREFIFKINYDVNW
ncbi:TonB-dependent receptor plug domain-containing protein [Bernardetia sp. Wsw4-3y2]|uniref:TonB-dependent receptor plug domain-containing protein n=1 Tax=Bernardetia sp. Wsw4-3y2 TaxID=3127471 RepID=UPI0030CF60E4